MRRQGKVGFEGEPVVGFGLKMKANKQLELGLKVVRFPNPLSS